MRSKDWRARIGIVMGADNVAIEPEMYAMAPDGVSFHFARVYRGAQKGGYSIDATKPKEVLKIFSYVKKIIPLAAAELSICDLDIVCYGSTMWSCIGGRPWTLELENSIKSAANCAATTNIDNCIRALKKLKIRKCAVVWTGSASSPIKGKSGQDVFKDVLRESGIEIVSTKAALAGYPLAEYPIFPKQKLLRIAKEADVPEADGIFIPNTGLRAIEIIQRLESDTGKPVVVANQAMLWDLIRSVGVNDSVAGYGTLLKDY